jgi:hypothetical protein
MIAHHTSSLYSHGRSVVLPPSGKVYEVEMLMGLFRKKGFESTIYYFEGYAL